MSFDVGKLLRVAPAAAPYAESLSMQLQRCDITTPLRIGMCLGQIHVESMGFRQVRESLNYGVNALLAEFGRHRISRDDAIRYGRSVEHPANQEMIANCLYGGRFGLRELGNTQPGDGWRFRGRGLKQLTGRANYTNFSRAWCGGDDVVNRPELVETPEVAVASAMWFWSSHHLNDLADTGDVAAVTAVVNGGDKGLDDRRRWSKLYESLMS